METTGPQAVPMNSLRRREPGADALYGTGGCESILLRVESQEFSIRTRISEEAARSELESLERDARFALFYQDQQFRIAAMNAKDRQEMPSVTVCRNLV